ncbi:MAG TPA: serine hydrolase domain-containing protein [Acidobacteriota bacterium]|nr:serine hydrolase domain-containing protein [Acidobacteriota bacterium]
MSSLQRRVGIVAAWTLLAAGCSIDIEHQSSSPRAVSELESSTDRWANEAVDNGAVAGLSLAVRQGDKLQFAKGYGSADLENGVLAAAETVYRIGSITKQFTAAAIMQLVERGKVALDDEIGEYVDFPTGGHRVTVHQLLNHTSGIKSYTGLGDVWTRTIPLPVTHEVLFGLLTDIPFDFAPGDEWRYNNTGFYLLGVIVENVTDKSYEEYLQQEVFDPLGLDDTSYCDEKKLIPHRAEGYESEDGELVNDDLIDMTHPFAAGALCSNVIDLLRWQQALERGEVVSAESYALMTTPTALNDSTETDYGYGIGVDTVEDHRRIAHGGGINGFVTMAARYPDDDLNVIVLTNTPGPTASDLEQRIARAALGLPEAPEDEEAEVP